MDEGVTMSNQLEQFLNEPENMHAREAILMHRMFFDVKLAATRSGYYLNTYFDDVDHDGFDVIFDDKDCLKKTQVKSVCSGAATNSWDIHKRILRPSIYLIEKLGFESSAVGEGNEGGVILMEFKDASDHLDVRYFYTDLFVLMAFESGIIKRRDGRRQKAIETCLEGLYVGLGSERLSVPKAAFIEAKNPNALLALAGMHSNNHGSWKHNVIVATNNIKLAADRSFELPAPIDKFVGFIGGEILELAADNDLLLN